MTWTAFGFNDTVPSSILYSATNPDLRPFAASGGKLILWHGWADQHISPQGTIQYWETMSKVTRTANPSPGFTCSRAWPTAVAVSARTRSTC